MALPGDEDRQADQRNAQQHGALLPAGAVQRHQAIEKADGAGGGNGQTQPVQAFAMAVGRCAARRIDGHKLQPQPDRGQAQRHHHEEHRAPAHPIHQQTAHAGADGRGQHNAHAKQPIGPALLMAGKGMQDDDGRNRLDHTGRQAFDHARYQHQVVVAAKTPANAPSISSITAPR